MNWRADVNPHVIDWPVTHSHLKMGEECELLGACAILDAKDNLVDAISGYIGKLERLEAIERAIFGNPVQFGVKGAWDWRYDA